MLCGCLTPKDFGRLYAAPRDEHGMIFVFLDVSEGATSKNSLHLTVPSACKHLTFYMLKGQSIASKRHDLNA